MKDSAISKYALDNGATVLYEMRNCPDVAMRITLNSGPLYEELDKLGATHFAEHMLFKSTPDMTSDDVTLNYQKISGRGPNAFTSHDSMSMDVRMPVGEFGRMTELLYSMISNKDFSSKEFENEKDVIKSEIRTLTEGPEESFIFDNMPRIFGKHPYSFVPCGTYESVGNMQINDLKELKERHFTGRNTYVAVVGSLKESKTLDILGKTFGKMEEGEASIPRYDVQSMEPGEVTRRFGVKNSVHVINRFPASRDPCSNVAQIMSRYLCGGMNSRIFQVVRKERGICYYLGSSYQGYLTDGIHFISAGSFDERRRDEVVGVILDEMERMERGELDMGLINLIKDGWRKNFYEKFRESISDRAKIISEAVSENWKYDPTDIPEIVSKCTTDEMKALAGKYFKDKLILNVEGI